MYDETENFRDYDSPLFNYPYELRKTKIASEFLQIAHNYTYDYHSYHINFEKSQTCLDDNIW